MSDSRTFGSRSRKRRNHCFQRRLRLEALECRNLLAVLSVGPGATYATIQEAVDHARPLDELYLAVDTYAESVDLSRMGISVGGGPGNLSIRGATTSATVRPSDGASFFNSAPFTGDLSFRDLTIEAPGPNAAGLSIHNLSGQLEVADMVFREIADTGLEVHGLEGELILRDSQFQAVGDGPSDYGVHVADVDGVLKISQNFFTDVTPGAIRLEASVDNVASVLVNGNEIQGDAVALSSTERGIEAQVTGNARLDLTMDDNRFLYMAGEAVSLLTEDTARLHARLSNGAIDTAIGESAVTLETRGTSQAAFSVLNNTLTEITGNGLRLTLLGNSTVHAVVENNLFLNIGDTANDTALMIQSDASASVDFHGAIQENDFVNASGIGVHVAAGGNSTYDFALLNNFFNEINKSGGEAALVVEQPDASSAATIRLALAGNFIESSAAGAYTLRHRGTGLFLLEGDAVDAASEIRDTNDGEPLSVSRTVTLVSLGTLDDFVPRLLGDRIWVDTDGDGIQGSNEPDHVGAMLHLVGNGESYATLSDAFGVYLFVALPGDYDVQLDVPSGYRLTQPGQGDDLDADSDLDPQTARAAVQLADQHQLSVDAGLLMTWQNPGNALDINNDGFVVPGDVLIIINDLNTFGSRALPSPPVPPNTPPPYLDPSGDGIIAPIDALIVINHLNGVPASGEGEAALAEIGFWYADAHVWHQSKSGTRRWT